MINTTQDWRRALGCYNIPIRNNLVPVNDIKIEYEQIDTSAQNSAMVTVSGSTSFSDHSEVMNLSLNYGSEHPIATLEPNEWVLDGNTEYIGTDTHCGWVSSEMCGADGTFTSNPKLTLTWSSVQSVTIPGVSVWWSSLLGEWASEFKVTAYNGITAVFQKTYSNSKVTDFYVGEIENYDKVEIEIIKWCIPYRRARIENVCMGFTVYISKSEVLTAEHGMSSDLLTFTLPDDYFTFDVDNVSEEWNPDNPTGRYAYLYERQRVTVKYAFKINGEYEWHKAGTYFMSDWTTPQNGISASFTARSLIEFMTRKFSVSSISGYTFGDSITLKQLATKAFQQADLPLDADGSVKWEIDNSLAEISVEIPWSGEGGYTRLDYIESHGTEWIDTGIKFSNGFNASIKFNMLSATETSDIDVFSSANGDNWLLISYLIDGFRLYANGNSANVEQLSVGVTTEATINYSNGIVTLSANGVTTSVNASGGSNSNLNFCTRNSNYGFSSSRIYYGKLYQGSTLVRNFIPAKRDSDGEVGLLDIVSGEFYENQGTGTFTYGTEMGSIGKNPKWDFDYSCAEVIQLCANASCTLIRPNEDGDICIVQPNQTVTDYYIDQFVSYSNGEYELAKPLKQININKGQLIYVPTDSVATGEEQGIENSLIQSNAQATDVCAWMSALLLKRKSITGEFRADPRLQPLDVITNVNKYSANRVYITDVKWSYSGAFRGSYGGKIIKSIPLADNYAEHYTGQYYSNEEYGGA